MFFAISPERAGCNAKISFLETSKFQACMFGEGATQLDFAVTSFPENSELVTSIDKLGRFCNDLSLFTDTAFCHAVRDVNAGFARPVAVDLCFEFGNDLDTFEDRIAFVESARKTAAKYGVRVGKCHSMFSAITALTVVVIGARKPIPACGEFSEGEVLISSSIGGFKEVYFHEQGHIRQSYSAAASHMCFDYSPHIENIGPSVIDISDVSGHGLGGALSSIAKRNCLDLSVELHPDIFFDPVAEEISCLQSDQPSNVQATSNVLELFLNQREVAGPLLLVTKGDGAEVLQYLRHQGLAASSIGRFQVGAGRVSVF